MRLARVGSLVVLAEMSGRTPSLRELEEVRRDVPGPKLLLLEARPA